MEKFSNSSILFCKLLLYINSISFVDFDNNKKEVDLSSVGIIPYYEPMHVDPDLSNSTSNNIDL